MHDRLSALAEESGLTLRSNPIVANGHMALEAAEWAREQGRATFETLHRALFAAYFVQARNISTIDQVSAVAAEQGLDAVALRVALAEEAYRQRIDDFTAQARENGIHGTPTFLLEDRYVIRGAQDFLVFTDALQRLRVPRRATGADEPDPSG